MANLTSVGYHERASAALTEATHISVGHEDTGFTYTFRNFFHPFVGELISKLNQGAETDPLAGVMDATWQDSLTQDFFNALYNPMEDNLVKVISFPNPIWDHRFTLHEAVLTFPAPGPHLQQYRVPAARISCSCPLRGLATRCRGASRRAWRACPRAFPSVSFRASCCSTSWVTCQP